MHRIKGHIESHQISTNTQEIRRGKITKNKLTSAASASNHLLPSLFSFLFFCSSSSSIYLQNRKLDPLLLLGHHFSNPPIPPSPNNNYHHHHFNSFLALILGGVRFRLDGLLEVLIFSLVIFGYRNHLLHRLAGRGVAGERRGINASAVSSVCEKQKRKKN
ncbi:unnamed protein product [Coffea canephora]|uniref:DH200=94 genomic scaffold, scaffold_109 n=1 Tax=Coffea canephora TaxID=49390 RepID=A0A068V7C8_COFCA|nr:unnamed protein product [Coffea canephora]